MKGALTACLKRRLNHASDKVDDEGKYCQVDF